MQMQEAEHKQYNAVKDTGVPRVFFCSEHSKKRYIEGGTFYDPSGHTIQST